MKFEVLRHKYYKRYLWTEAEAGAGDEKGFLLPLFFLSFPLLLALVNITTQTQWHVDPKHQRNFSLLDNFNYLSCAGMDETSIRFSKWIKEKVKPLALYQKKKSDRHLEKWWGGGGKEWEWSGWVLTLKRWKHRKDGYSKWISLHSFCIHWTRKLVINVIKLLIVKWRPSAFTSTW